MDLGAGRRGVDMGPSAIRIGRLSKKLRKMMGLKVEDVGNIEVRIPEEVPYGEKNQMYLAEISEACARLSERVLSTLRGGQFPLVLGGERSIAAGSIAGVSAFYRQQGQRIGLIWIDAHTDMNTPRTNPSGNVHGMPLAALFGLGPTELSEIQGFSPKIDATHTTLVGVRSVDPSEKANMRVSVSEWSP